MKRLMTVFLFGIFGYAQVWGQVPTNGLVAYYPFNGNANDESGNHLNAIVYGATLTTDRHNSPNSAYNFDYTHAVFSQRNDDVYVPYSPLLNVSNITTSVWVYIRSYSWSGNPGSSTIFNRYEGGYSNPNGQAWGMGFDQTNLSAGFLEASTTNSQRSAGVSCSTPPLNSWNHVVFTFDGSMLKLYLNGNLVSTASTTLAMNTLGSSGISIGESDAANGCWHYMDGMIDDFRIYNRALTSGEIQSLYLEGDESPASLVSPPMDSVLNSDSVQFVWTKTYPNSSKYWLELAADSMFSSPTIDSTIVDTSTIVIAPKPGAYWWRVKGWTAGGWGTYSQKGRFQYVISTNGLVAWYSFTGNANDSSGNGRHGTVFGASLGPNRFGFGNSAFYFDGTDDYIKASGVALPSKSRTVSFWFKANSVANGPGLLAYGGSGACGDSWLQTINIEGDSYMVNSHCNVRRIAAVYSTPPLAKWHQWVVTTGPSGTKMYIDGALIASNGASFDNTYTLGGDLGFGTTAYWDGRVPYGAYFFNGALDDIRIYDYPLTPSQVDSLYRLEARPPDPDPVVAITPPHGYVTGADTASIRWYRGGPVVTRYWFEASPDSLFEFTKIDSMVVDTAFVIRNLAPAKDYWWRVRAYSGWSYGPFSSPRSIHVVAVPAQVQLLLPVHGQVLSADSARLSWQQAQPYVDRYSVEFSLDSSFALKFADSTVSGTSYVVRGLTKAFVYWWRVKAHNAAGWGAFSAKSSFSALFTGVDGSDEVPRQFSLDQNYPNPFNPSTRIRYGLPQKSTVSLVVFNTLGQQVGSLFQGEQEAGYYEVNFDASGLSSGVYFYRLQAGSYVQTKKLLLMR